MAHIYLDKTYNRVPKEVLWSCLETNHINHGSKLWQNCGHSMTKWPHRKGFEVKQTAFSLCQNRNMLSDHHVRAILQCTTATEAYFKRLVPVAYTWIIKDTNETGKMSARTFSGEREFFSLTLSYFSPSVLQLLWMSFTKRSKIRHYGACYFANDGVVVMKLNNELITS